MLEFLLSLVLLQEAQHTQGNQGTQDAQENQGNQHFKTGNHWPVQEVLCVIKKACPDESQLRRKSMSNSQTFEIAGGRIACIQCQAQSKRTGQQCRAPAIAGKTKCRFHGGKSTGPKTPEGRQRCAQARTTHGQETTSMRIERRLASARLAVLESVGFGLGMMTGIRTPGRRPDRMAEVYPELQALFQELVVKRAKPGA